MNSRQKALEEILALILGLLYLALLPSSFLLVRTLKNKESERVPETLGAVMFYVALGVCFFLPSRGHQLLILLWGLFHQGVLGVISIGSFGSFKDLKTVRLRDFKGGGSIDASGDEGARSQSLRLGIDLRTKDWVELSDQTRTAHSLIIGATGTGKTTLMLNMIKHAALMGHPLVVIDPKGEDSTYLELQEFLTRHNLIHRLKRFSMSKPSESYHYNPLKYGNPNQLKDRIMEALNWSEQYYQSVAGSYLTALTSATTYLGMTLTLDLISRLLSYKEEQALLLKELKSRFQDGDRDALPLYERVNHFFSQSGDHLGGLQAQIAILNNPTFGGILSNIDKGREMDLRVMRRESGIAYFQLDTLGNADSARRLGRMIIEDLKSMSSEVYKDEVQSIRPFFPIFIDEFGSFASREFIEFLKQGRGAKFGLHLFCQGLEDLDAISTEFRRQVLSNALSKIALRVDDISTVEEFCGSAGTIDSLEQSYQVEGQIIKSRTGAGNERITKQMVIEHDVLKNLKTGEAVFIDKSKGHSHPIKIIPFH